MHGFISLKKKLVVDNDELNYLIKEALMKNNFKTVKTIVKVH